LASPRNAAAGSQPTWSERAAVIWKRIPHQFVLAFAFGAIAVGVAVAVLVNVATALRATDATIAYGTMELHGIRDLAATHRALRELVAYRAELLRLTIFSRTRSSQPAPPPDAAGRNAAVTAAIAAISATAAHDRPVAAALEEPLGTLQNRWSLTASQTNVSVEDLSAVIAIVQPVLIAISGSSGVSNDPSIDGINFGDAIVRFPLSLAYGSEAASIAAAALATGDAALKSRFYTARLLAQAQTAVDIGKQDARDELAVDATSGAVISAAASANVRDFEQLKYCVTDGYVESAGRPRIGHADRELLTDLDAFTSSSFAVVDILRADLDRVTGARMLDTRRSQSDLLWQAGRGLALVVVLMIALARISTSSYRTAAERAALESQRARLELALTHATAQQALLRAKAQFRGVFDRAPTGMIIVDRECRTLDSNDAARAMLESGGDVAGAAAVVHDHAAAIERIFAGESELHAQEYAYIDARRESRWLHVTISCVRDEAGTALVAILMLRDITESKTMEAQLVFEAGHDALTGLPNRKLFLNILQRALDERGSPNAPETFSVVFIDFDDFKTINDSFGHQAGDKFLVDEAARLRDAIRSTDIVARVGGDEFALVLVGADRSDIEMNVARLQAAVSIPINIEGQLVASSASFGIAQAEPGYRLAAEIIRDADTAMYHAKAQGGRKYVAFDSSMREKVVRRMQMSIDIVHALEHQELELLYQPIVDLRSGKIAACEALVRWRRADGSLVAPTEFLPLAEENGSIIEIGRWVTKTACEQMHAWNELSRIRRLAGLNADFVMHVNLAVPEVDHVDLLASLNWALAETSVSRDQIVLEITEGIVLKNTEHTRSTLAGLSEAGFKLCIDDFGTGYSSLRYLNELPLHGFKIDRSFVSSGKNELANASIVEMLMVLSRSLDLQVVAEGIETPRQLERLRELGCRQGQGYLFAPALEAAAFTAQLEANVPLAHQTEIPAGAALVGVSLL
jgi:diguanylate cyclase (GGDEF)-like protein